MKQLERHVCPDWKRNADSEAGTSSGKLSDVLLKALRQCSSKGRVEDALAEDKRLYA